MGVDLLSKNVVLASYSHADVACIIFAVNQNSKVGCHSIIFTFNILFIKVCSNKSQRKIIILFCLTQVMILRAL